MRLTPVMCVLALAAYGQPVAGPAEDPPAAEPPAAPAGEAPSSSDNAAEVPARSVSTDWPVDAPADEQPAPPQALWSLDLTIRDVGLGLGHSRHIDGLRVNFRDLGPFVAHGLNLTLWWPPEKPAGTIAGLAIGLPATGAGVVRGLGLGALFKVGRFDGAGVGLGIAADDSLNGLFVTGLGVGAGGDLRGVFVGGLGAGCGGSFTGVLVGGLGGGCGGSLTGLLVGGLGVGGGGSVRGIALGGLGVGAGGNIDGIALGLLGVGAGGDIRGLAVAVLGVGSGGTVTGLAVGGVGVGAAAVRGAIIGLVAGGRDVAGLVVAPAYFTVEPEGGFTGVALSAVNRIQGEQRGLTIGLVNIAARLHGVQLGLVNYAGNNSTFKVMPLVNAHFD